MKHKHRNNLARRVNVRPLRRRFLIVCEGESTEPRYFASFRVSKLIIVVKGIGKNTVGLVQEALILRQQENFDEVWCVFDRDQFPADAFNRAISLAQQEGIRVAYSNEAFELWYLLHFHYHDTAISRFDYGDKLTVCLNRTYNKKDPHLDMYSLLHSRQSDAIRHAIRLLESYGDHHNPARDNPVTTVHQLVLSLIEDSR
jgi:hypothetical protein